MSQLAEKTNIKFIRAAAKAIKVLESAINSNLGITHDDDVDICKARRLLLGVIDAGGYELNDNGKLSSTVKTTCPAR